MADTSGLIAAGLGLGVGLTLLVAGRRADAAAPAPAPAPAPASGPGTDPCDALAPLGAGAVAACKALRGAGKVIGGLGDILSTEPDWKGRDETNRTINGEVALPLDEGLKTRSFCLRYSAGTEAAWPMLNGSVLRYANGCEPFEGAPGWSRCAPGTQNMFRSCAHSSTVGRHQLWSPLHGGEQPPQKGSIRDLPRVSAAAMFAVVAGDPTTSGPIAADAVDYIHHYNTVKKRPLKFPLPIGAGQVGWWIAGRPLVCAEGQIPPRVRDHRATGGYVYQCAATPPVWAPDDPDQEINCWVVVGGEGRWEMRRRRDCPQVAQEAGDPPPREGWCWVRPAPGAPGYWQRPRAGFNCDGTTRTSP